MITRRFEAREHEEYGMLGWVPCWMAHADPLTGIAIPHDILEHTPRDRGEVHQELMALGAAYWLRGETGYFQHNGNINPPELHIASDFPDIFRHFLYEGFRFEKCKPIRLKEEEIDLQTVVRLGFCELNNEIFRDGETMPDDFPLPCEILAWLVRGYRKAQIRYKGLDAYSLAFSVFDPIAKIPAPDYEGQTLIVRIDLSSYSCWHQINDY